MALKSGGLALRILFIVAAVTSLTLGAVVITSAPSPAPQSEPTNQVQTIKGCPEDAIVISTWTRTSPPHEPAACITWDDLSEQTQQEIAEETMQYNSDPHRVDVTTQGG